MPGGGAAPLVLLAAGGTGGHLFPAEALAQALARRGLTVDLATDERAERYGKRFPARQTHVIASETLRGRNVVALARTGAIMSLALLRAYMLLGRIKPAVVVGFGGYPTLAPVLAATWRRIPTIIHEQNAVMGRANKLLAPRVSAIATSFPGVLDAAPRLAAKATPTGNPVRPAVIAAAAMPYPDLASDGLLRLLVFGGSQGARIMSEIVPAALERLDQALRIRLLVAQQARGEDLAEVRADVWAAEHQRRGRGFLSGPAGADRGCPSGGLALGRLDGGRARRHRAAGDSGAAAPCARSGPACQCGHPGAGRRRHPAAPG